ncbi:MAG: PKD domain-containing protein, partial [Bacteroidota bacterium]|nr:PKD domain-containing protein [Bacteroidota bacterium]
MRNRILLLISGALLVANFGFAQVCGTYEGSLEEQIQKYPDFYQSLESKNTELELQHEKALSKMTSVKVENGVKIIPVVVHIIHNGGGENLNVAQIQNGLDHLNDNINGQAYNFLTVTPDVFAALRGDLNVEFRLAKIDPEGNPTSGIVRVQSELTVATVTETLSRDRVKALSYWNSFQYFNIWVVQSMPAGPDPITQPALNGYAQFPWSGRMSTDGVMIRAAVFAAGETITHEVGHWLGLCHTWSCGGGTCGTDNVADTPTDREGTFDFNGTFPFNVNVCPDPNGPAGEMYMNYMDYQADGVQSMFTKGQNVVMNETLEGIYDAETNDTDIGYREYMWSPENIAATGTADGFIPEFCNQKADFASMSGVSLLCEGEQIVLKGNQTIFGAGNVSSFVWDFGDNTTDNSGNNFLSHTYNSAGTYNVTLTVEYDETTEVLASSLADLDIANASSYDSISENLIVQGTEEELNNLGASNIALHIDDAGYSLDSYWKNNQFTVDSLVGAFHIDAFQADIVEDSIVIYLDGGNNTPTPDSVLVIDDGDSTYVYIDGANLTAQDLVLLGTPENNADSSTIFTTEFIVDYLDSIIEYSFYYDTT